MYDFNHLLFFGIMCVKSHSHILMWDVISRWWGGNKMKDVNFHHFYFIYMASMIDDKVVFMSDYHYNTTTDCGRNHCMMPPKFNFSGIGHVANHCTWTEVTTFHFNPIYYWIFVGSQWILPLHPFFHRTSWSIPKFLVRPKMGLNYSNNGIVRNSGHAPSSQH
jgi:hypothetical protein